MTSATSLFRVTTYAVLVLALAGSAHATYIGRSWVVTGTEAPWLGGTTAVFPNPTTGLDATFASTISQLVEPTRADCSAWQRGVTILSLFICRSRPRA
jgi:hypothetical protein